MKKIKLITSLSALGILTSLTPLFATSCSNNNTTPTNKMTFKGKEYDLVDNINPNTFCGEDNWVINTKNNGQLTITPDERSYIISLSLKSTDTSTELYDYFLNNCDNLEFIDLSGLKLITKIGDNFLGFCSALNEIDLNPLSNVSILGAGFLDNCSSLKNINLTPLDNITTIEGSFMRSCSGLSHIDLTPLQYVSNIDYTFLGYCTGLTEIDLSPFEHVKTIGNSFLKGCSGIEELDFSDMENVWKIGDNFLYNCDKLTTVNLGAISADVLTNSTKSFATENSTAPMYKDGIKLRGEKAKEIKEIFVSENSKVFRNWAENKMTYKDKTYHLADNLDPDIFTTDVWTIPLYDGSTIDIPSGENDRWKLTSLIFKFCDSSKDAIDDHFLFGCQGLTELDLTGLSYIKVLGSDSFQQCHALTYADFSSWINIEAIGTHFLFSCNSLEAVNMGNIKASILDTVDHNVSFTCGTETCIPYVNGLKIIGTDKASYLTRFPKIEGTVWNMWRNLVLG